MAAGLFSTCVWVLLLPVLALVAVWAIRAAQKPAAPSAGQGYGAPSDRLRDPVEDEAETFFASEELIFEDEEME